VIPTRTTSGSPPYGFRPDWCETADPESQGIVEHLVGYAKHDLMVNRLGFSLDPPVLL
jgi:transposase